MNEDDMNTRLVLLEKTAVTREILVEREEKLIDRIDSLITKHQAQAAEDQKHALRVFGHDIADQFRDWSAKIHSERDEIDEKREADRAPVMAGPPSMSPIRTWIAANWMWAASIALLVVILRPDLADAAFRALM